MIITLLGSSLRRIKVYGRSRVRYDIDPCRTSTTPRATRSTAGPKLQYNACTPSRYYRSIDLPYPTVSLRWCMIRDSCIVTSRRPTSYSGMLAIRRPLAWCTFSTLVWRGTVDRSKIKDQRSLHRQYATEDPRQKGFYRPRRARPHTDFRGTMNFAAPAMHDGAELVRGWSLIFDLWPLDQGRKDDLWSWLFMLIDLHATLPWANCDTVEEIGKVKQNMKDEELMTKMPSKFDLWAPSLIFGLSGELLPVPKHLRSLDVYNRPDYSLIYGCLHAVFKRCKVQ